MKMVDITKDEYWEGNYKEKEKSSFVKKIILKNKFLSVLFLIFGVFMIANTILIYSFFEILSEL